MLDRDKMIKSQGGPSACAERPQKSTTSEDAHKVAEEILLVRDYFTCEWQSETLDASTSLSSFFFKEKQEDEAQLVDVAQSALTLLKRLLHKECREREKRHDSANLSKFNVCICGPATTAQHTSGNEEPIPCSIRCAPPRSIPPKAHHQCKHACCKRKPLLEPDVRSSCCS